MEAAVATRPSVLTGYDTFERLVSSQPESVAQLRRADEEADQG